MNGPLGGAEGGAKVRGDGGMDFGVGGAGVQGCRHPRGERSKPRGRRDGSRCGVQRLGNEPEEPLSGPLDFLGSLQVGHGMRNDVELGKGDPRL